MIKFINKLKFKKIKNKSYYIYLKTFLIKLINNNYKVYK